MSTLPPSRIALLAGTALSGTMMLGVLILPVGSTWAQSPPPAERALPTDPTIRSGAITIESSTNRLDIRQDTQKGIIDWRSFDIGRGNTVEFRQPNADAITLNRVTGDQRSQIFGDLKANGQVWLVNPAGIFFGASARVDVSGLIATTHDIRNEDFLSDRHVFTAVPGAAGSVENDGEITIRNAGLAGLVAPHVANRGTIVARMGRVTLASGQRFDVVDLYGDGMINLEVTGAITQRPQTASGEAADALVDNRGTIIADGGHVLLTASAAAGVIDRVVNTGGIVQARTVAQNADGSIELMGSGGEVRVAGTVDASAVEAGLRGGSITATGDQVRVANNAIVTASGPSGGGDIRLGGDYLGGRAGPERLAQLRVRPAPRPVPTAKRTVIEDGAQIHADATDAGTGGQVIVWSDESTVVAGAISARGGPNGGDGGFVETSGLLGLRVLRAPDVSAPQGRNGSWLIDPTNITITDSNDAIVALNFGDGGGLEVFPDGAPTDASIDVSVIIDALESGTNVTVSTASNGAGYGDINIDSALDLDLGGNNETVTLELFADGSININNDILVNGGGISLDFNAGGTIGLGSGAEIAATNGASIDGFWSSDGGYDFAGTISADGNRSRIDLNLFEVSNGGINASITGTILAMNGGQVSITSETNGAIDLDALLTATGSGSTISLDLTAGSISVGQSSGFEASALDGGAIDLSFNPANAGSSTINFSATLDAQTGGSIDIGGEDAFLSVGISSTTITADGAGSSVSIVAISDESDSTLDASAVTVAITAGAQATIAFASGGTATVDGDFSVDGEGSVLNFIAASVFGDLTFSGLITAANGGVVIGGGELPAPGGEFEEEFLQAFEAISIPQSETQALLFAGGSLTVDGSLTTGTEGRFVRRSDNGEQEAFVLLSLDDDDVSEITLIAGSDLFINGDIETDADELDLDLTAGTGSTITLPNSISAANQISFAITGGILTSSGGLISLTRDAEAADLIVMFGASQSLAIGTFDEGVPSDFAGVDASVFASITGAEAIEVDTFGEDGELRVGSLDATPIDVPLRLTTAFGDITVEGSLTVPRLYVDAGTDPDAFAVFTITSTGSVFISNPLSVEGEDPSDADPVTQIEPSAGISEDDLLNSPIDLRIRAYEIVVEEDGTLNSVDEFGPFTGAVLRARVFDFNETAQITANTLVLAGFDVDDDIDVGTANTEAPTRIESATLSIAASAIQPGGILLIGEPDRIDNDTGNGTITIGGVLDLAGPTVFAMEGEDGRIVVEEDAAITSTGTFTLSSVTGDSFEVALGFLAGGNGLQIDGTVTAGEAGSSLLGLAFQGNTIKFGSNASVTGEDAIIFGLQDADFTGSQFSDRIFISDDFDSSANPFPSQTFLGSDLRFSNSGLATRLDQAALDALAGDGINTGFSRLVLFTGDDGGSVVRIGGTSPIDIGLDTVILTEADDATILFTGVTTVDVSNGGLRVVMTGDESIIGFGDGVAVDVMGSINIDVRGIDGRIVADQGVESPRTQIMAGAVSLLVSGERGEPIGEAAIDLDGVDFDVTGAVSITTDADDAGIDLAAVSFQNAGDVSIATTSNDAGVSFVDVSLGTITGLTVSTLGDGSAIDLDDVSVAATNDISVRTSGSNAGITIDTSTLDAGGALNITTAGGTASIAVTDAALFGNGGAGLTISTTGTGSDISYSSSDGESFTLAGASVALRTAAGSVAVTGATVSTTGEASFTTGAAGGAIQLTDLVLPSGEGGADPVGSLLISTEHADAGVALDGVDIAATGDITIATIGTDAGITVDTSTLDAGGALRIDTAGTGSDIAFGSSGSTALGGSSIGIEAILGAVTGLSTPILETLGDISVLAGASDTALDLTEVSWTTDGSITVRTTGSNAGIMIGQSTLDAGQTLRIETGGSASQIFVIDSGLLGQGADGLEIVTFGNESNIQFVSTDGGDPLDLTGLNIILNAGGTIDLNGTNLLTDGDIELLTQGVGGTITLTGIAYDVMGDISVITTGTNAAISVTRSDLQADGTVLLSTAGTQSAISVSDTALSGSSVTLMTSGTVSDISVVGDTEVSELIGGVVALAASASDLVLETVRVDVTGAVSIRTGIADDASQTGGTASLIDVTIANAGSLEIVTENTEASIELDAVKLDPEGTLAGFQISTTGSKANITLNDVDLATTGDITVETSGANAEVTVDDFTLDADGALSITTAGTGSDIAFGSSGSAALRGGSSVAIEAVLGAITGLSTPTLGSDGNISVLAGASNTALTLTGVTWETDGNISVATTGSNAGITIDGSTLDAGGTLNIGTEGGNSSITVTETSGGTLIAANDLITISTVGGEADIVLEGDLSAEDSGGIRLSTTGDNADIFYRGSIVAGSGGLIATTTGFDADQWLDESNPSIVVTSGSLDITTTGVFSWIILDQASVSVADGNATLRTEADASGSQQAKVDVINSSITVLGGDLVVETLGASAPITISNSSLIATDSSPESEPSPGDRSLSMFEISGSGGQLFITAGGSNSLIDIGSNTALTASSGVVISSSGAGGDVSVDGIDIDSPEISISGYDVGIGDVSDVSVDGDTRLSLSASRDVTFSGQVASLSVPLTEITVFEAINVTIASDSTIFTRSFRQLSGSGGTFVDGTLDVFDESFINTDSLLGSGFNLGGLLTVDVTFGEIFGNFDDPQGELGTGVQRTGAALDPGSVVSVNGILLTGAPPPVNDSDVGRSAVDQVLQIDLPEVIESGDVQINLDTVNAPITVPTFDNPSLLPTFVSETAPPFEGALADNNFVQNLQRVNESIRDGNVLVALNQGISLGFTNFQLQFMLQPLSIEQIRTSLAASSDPVAQQVALLIPGIVDGTVTFAQFQAFLQQSNLSPVQVRAYLALYARARAEGRSNDYAPGLQQALQAIDQAALNRINVPPPEFGRITITPIPGTGRVLIRGEIGNPGRFPLVRAGGRHVYVREDGGFEAEIPASSATSEITVAAVNESGVVVQQQTRLQASQLAQLNPQPDPAPVGRRIALIIAVEQYRDADIPDLSTPSSDADAVGNVLRQRFGYDVRKIQNGTRDQIFSAIRSLAQELQQEDQVVIYYAGHGYSIYGTDLAFWLPADAQTDRGNAWISSAELSRLFHRMPAQQILLIADSCYSGGFAAEQLQDRADIPANELIQRRAVMALTSGGDEPVSDGTQNSPFASALVRRLNELDQSTPLADLVTIVRGDVEAVTPQTPNYGIIRFAGYDDGSDFVVAPQRTRVSQANEP